MVADLDAGCERSRGREELQERLKDSEERDYRRQRRQRVRIVVTRLRFTPERVLKALHH